MMNQNRIRQQEAAVEMLRLQVSASRARPEKLEAAINELNRLKSESVAIGSSVPDKVRVARPSRLVQSIMKDVTGDAIMLRQSGLSEEANRLRKEQSELSNMLHKVPEGQPCTELTSRILGLHEQIENIWDQKKFLERNRHDGPAVLAHDQQVKPRSLDDVQSKAELTVLVQKQREKCSKLKRKIEDPKANESSKTKWKIELANAQAVIEEAVTKRTLL